MSVSADGKMRGSSESIKENSRRTFDGMARRYESGFTGRHASKLCARVLGELEGYHYESLLDVGCGTGTFLSLLSPRMGIALSGIDLSPEMMEVAREKLDGKADLRIEDSETMPWKPGSFEVVTCTDSFHHYPHPEEVLHEIRRVLRPGGLLILADPWWPTPVRQILNLVLPLLRTGDVRVCSESEIRRLLKTTGFQTVKWEKVGRSGCISVARSE